MSKITFGTVEDKKEADLIEAWMLITDYFIGWYERRNLPPSKGVRVKTWTEFLEDCPELLERLKI